MIQYLLEKMETIKKQRELFCTNAKNTQNTTTLLYDLICENTHGKGISIDKQNATDKQNKNN